MDKKDLNTKNFYDQACAYFYYHAGQRTTMINYFIAAFGAFIALYGALISVYTIASMLIAVFMGIVSMIFFMIDLRNKFDVKKSENVIRQIERDHGVDKPVGDYPYGVFSNETNTYKYYNLKARRSGNEYSKLRKLAKLVAKGKADESELDARIIAFVESDPTVSYHEVKDSLNQETIISLSFCIKLLYILCMVISALAFAFALILVLGVI